MSKIGKLKARIQRRSAKAARKASRQRQWDIWMAAGVNGKKMNKNAKRVRHELGKHALDRCWNIGCKRCNPAPYNLLPLWQLHE